MRWFLPLLLGLVALSACSPSTPPPVAATKPPEPTPTAAPVRWFDSIEAAHLAWPARPVLVQVSAEWCLWCATLEVETLEESELRRLLNARVVAVRLGEEALAASGLAPAELPSLILLSAEGEELGRLKGTVPAALVRDWLVELLPD